MSSAQRPVPVVTPETTHFWAGTRRGELLLQECTPCAATYFPPRPFCPTCSSRDVHVVQASGRATLASYIVSHLPAPGFEPPYVIAIVQLQEGPRMLTNVVDCAQSPEALELDMPLEVTYSQMTDEITLPLFRPEGG
jgi:uncharacterized OB-fold protein